MDTIKRHHVGSWKDAAYRLPAIYEGHCEGYSRASLVGHTTAPTSVHMGVALVKIEPGGSLAPHPHAYEKGFYVLEGSVIVSLDGQAYQLGADDYGLIPLGATHAWRNTGSQAVTILEMIAPQPKPPENDFKDTFFHPSGSAPSDGDVPALSDPRVSKYLGRFDESQLPTAGQIAAAGARGASIHGVSIVEFIDRMLGAQHMAMFLVQFQPGGEGTIHDHMMEETYFIISGEAEANLDGNVYHVKAGDYVWNGVGCMHGFKNIGSGPVRWIETQAPLPTPTEAFRFKAQWEALRKKIEG
jgi:quercetin dioxygenase-like cupin family protein